jgi:purine nucleosidase
MIKVIMDVDTGIDDAIAIMMALQSPEIEIVGIMTV